MLLLARIFRLGFLADFLSRTVLVGFLTGVGVQVAIAMLGDMLGITVSARNTILQAWQIARGLPRFSAPTLVLSSLVVAAILGGRRTAPRIPVALVLVVGAIAASRAFELGRARGGDDGPPPGGIAFVRSVPRHLERDPPAPARRRLLFRRDHRAECGHGPRPRSAL